MLGSRVFLRRFTGSGSQTPVLTGQSLLNPGRVTGGRWRCMTDPTVEQGMDLTFKVASWGNLQMFHIQLELNLEGKREKRAAGEVID